MSGPRRVRAEQTGARGRALALGVACSESDVGTALAASVGQHEDVAEVRPLRRSPDLPDLVGVDAVVVPPDAGPGSVAQVVGAVAAAADLCVAPRLVLVTSAEVYGALPDNPVPLREEGPLRAKATTRRMAELLEVEVLAARAAQEHPRLSVTVLRPAALVGRGLGSPLAGHFAASRLLVVRGSGPRWQFCHVDDLGAAVVLAAAGRVPGVATVACDGWLEQEEVEALTGLRRVELPATLAFTAAERLRRLGVVPNAASATDLAYLVHPWVVPSARLRARGWRAEHDNAEVLLEMQATTAGVDESRRLGARDATLASVGAAVTVVGTAALLRVARRRRRG